MAPWVQQWTSDPQIPTESIRRSTYTICKMVRQRRHYPLPITQNNKLDTEKDAKWKMRILRQIHMYCTADPVCTGRKSCQYSYISGHEYSCSGATFCPYQLVQLYALGAISLSSVLSPILYAAYYSMVHRCKRYLLLH